MKAKASATPPNCASTPHKEVMNRLSMPSGRAVLTAYAKIAAHHGTDDRRQRREDDRLLESGEEAGVAQGADVAEREVTVADEGGDDHDQGRDQQEDRRVGEERHDAGEGARRLDAAERPRPAARALSQRPWPSWR
jgi:hypothetical protein